MTDVELSLVVATYFEEDCIDQFFTKTIPCLEILGVQWEIVLIDDGSTDHTCEKIRLWCSKDSRIKLIELSYNHGKAGALTAGYTAASGSYVLSMDPDLQDPPESIVDFYIKAKSGYDIVLGIREKQQGKWLNVLFSKVFWFALNRASGLTLPSNLAVMRIFSRRFMDQLLRYREQNRFIEGMMIHVGMKRATVDVAHRERALGNSKFSFRRRMRLAADAILDFSELPLKLASRAGLAIVLMSFLAIVFLFIMRFFFTFQVGWPSLAVIMLFCMGIQLMFMGVIGAYIGRIYKEVKGRPLYSVKQTTNL